MHELTGFILAIAFHAGIAGAIIGILWSLALGIRMIPGLIMGTCIAIVVWLLLGLSATASGRINQREAAFVIGSMMPVVSGLAAVLALVVWGIRVLF